MMLDPPFLLVFYSQFWSYTDLEELYSKWNVLGGKNIRGLYLFIVKNEEYSLLK